MTRQGLAERLLNPRAIVKGLIKQIGPIPSYAIMPQGAVYTQVVVTTANKLAHSKVEGIPVVPIDAKVARQWANSEGRIECFHGLGELDEALAADLLLRMYDRLDFRAKYGDALKAALAAYQKYLEIIHYSLPDPNAPTHLGWRVWHWSSLKQRLISPSMGTIWHGAELRVPKWDTEEAIRGYAGIHAALMPYDWAQADVANHDELRGFTSIYSTALDAFSYAMDDRVPIDGVVERFGRYVLGTIGWRAEWVIIRKLRVPNTEIGLKIEKVYGPDVELLYQKE